MSLASRYRDKEQIIKEELIDKERKFTMHNTYSMTVSLSNNSYPIYIESGLLKKVASYLPEVWRGKRIVILSDDNVFSFYGEALIASLGDYECTSVVLPAGEAAKSFNSLPKIYSQFIESQISRSDLLIALGGGVIGDLAGFVAATYLRGVPFVQIPTSLLAQVDSSVGGKVAVDLPEGKNMVGAFYHPKLVLIDPDTLLTLPTRYINDGMGEVIKYGCIKDAALFRLLNEASSFSCLLPKMSEIIYRCVDSKRLIVEQDPFDKGERMLLNFGHTLGHAIEQYYHYQRESHGEAVAIGMYQITRIAEEQGLTKTDTAKTLKEILTKYDLPTSADIDCNRLLVGISRDKKNLNNHLNLILLKEIGESYIYPSNLNFFTNAGMI